MPLVKFFLLKKKSHDKLKLTCKNIRKLAANDNLKKKLLIFLLVHFHRNTIQTNTKNNSFEFDFQRPTIPKVNHLHLENFVLIAIRQVLPIQLSTLSVFVVIYSTVLRQSILS
ncbi:hypothetical protein CHUAL_004862 [Chamberlinius hualienensis]